MPVKVKQDKVIAVMNYRGRAGDLWHLGGMRTSFAHCMHGGIIQCDFAPSMSSTGQVKSPAWTCCDAGSTRCYISSYNFALISCFTRPFCSRWWSAENLNVHDKRQKKKETKICLSGREHSQPRCAVLHMAIKLICELFIKKTKGLKKQGALLKTEIQSLWLAQEPLLLNCRPSIKCYVLHLLLEMFSVMYSITHSV